MWLLGVDRKIIKKFLWKQTFGVGGGKGVGVGFLEKS